MLDTGFRSILSQSSRVYHVVFITFSINLGDNAAAPLRAVDFGCLPDSETNTRGPKQSCGCSRVLAGVEIDVGAVLVSVLSGGLSAERVTLRY